jgi:toxin-antitoxin system PIN domain toxin
LILVDANLLVYAYVESMAQHAEARTWLNKKLSGPNRVGLPWASLLAFVRLVSNPRVFARACSVGQAWQVVESWLDCPTVWIPVPTERHRAVLGAMIHSGTNYSRLVADAHLAALAIEHGLTLQSTDGDFARFAGLRWENPLLQ